MYMLYIVKMSDTNIKNQKSSMHFSNHIYMWLLSEKVET